MLGLKVKKKRGEEVRQDLLENDLLDVGYKIKETKNYLIFPLKEEFGGENGEIIESGFEKRENQKNIEGVLREKGRSLTEEELQMLPSSYDLIGDILVLNLKEELIPKENQIGRAFLERFKNVNVVAREKGPVKGEFRIQKVKVIAGEDRTETLHKENNCKFKLDINEVFYTPRMARERSIIADKVEDGEKVVDLFAGVGPFSILIAKENKVEVTSIEKNEAAYNYLRKNEKLNNVENKVKSYHGDCRKVVKREELKNTADCIIMNLPGRSEEFLKTAEYVAKKGAVVHFYHFSDEAELYQEVIDLIEERIGNIEVLDKRTCGQIAPGKYRVCVDFRLNP